MSREDITEGMARALWVMAYADWVEGLSREERKEAGAPVSLQGVDWFDDSPETPAAAEKAGVELASLYESENDVGVMELAKRAAKADGVDEDDLDYSTFGFYLGMMALGHGSSWFDDHENFDVKSPSIESHYDGEFFEWSGRCKTSYKNPACEAAPPTPAPTVNPWHVSSDSGLEGVFADKDNADFYADEIRGAGATNVQVINRIKQYLRVPRPVGAPPMHHRPHGRPPGVPNPKPNVTELEVAALNNLIKSGYDGPSYWAFCATGGPVTERVVGGVVSSLAKKGLVICQGYGDEATIEITAKGIQAAKKGNPAGLTAKGERMYEHVKAGYAGDPRADEIASRTVLARAKATPGLRNPPNVLPVPGQTIKSWDHGAGRLVKICEEGTDGSYTAMIRLADGGNVSVPLARTEYDLTPRKNVERRTGFSRHEQFVGPPQPDRLPKGTPMDFDDGATTVASPRRKR
jgi:hypothetical protein